MNPSNIVKYTVDYIDVHRHFINFTGVFKVENENSFELHLPMWRPGRYEKTNYVRCIQKIEAVNENGKAISIEKKTTNSWIIDTSNCSEVSVSYNFYTSRIDAGTSYIDEDILYINPVNCFLYEPKNIDAQFEVSLNIPDNFKISSGLIFNKKKTTARNFQQLFDCPILASPNLHQFEYFQNEIPFYIHIYGDINFDINKLKSEFEAFTIDQIKAFSSFPEKDYHFIFLFLDEPSYHGVEHENSTVITLGPAHKLSERDFYKELLGVSSHELYHTWNIKKIRPKEMFPYNFQKENYSKLGYVAEGVTTYMGDHYLWRSDFFSLTDYMLELSTLSQKHFDNPGRLNKSVADSSYDTWVDGYEMGIPWRKVSIYNEGALCSLIIDITIINNSKGQFSLDNVMQDLWLSVNDSYEGYTEQDYINAINKYAGIDIRPFFEKHIWGFNDLTDELKNNLNLVGLELVKIKPTANQEYLLGVKTNDKNQILSILENSPADKAGLWIADTITSISDKEVLNISTQIAIHESKTTGLNFLRKGKLKTTEVLPIAENTYAKWIVRPVKSMSEKQKGNFKHWKRS